MTRILMVCLGNICRSPLAEGIMRSKLPEQSFYVDSAGTNSYHIGESPDPRSMAVASNYGLDISGQKARAFTVADFKAFDYIFAMDRSNYHDIIRLAPDTNDQKKVALILDHLKPSKLTEVPDPYYGGNQGFEKVYQLLDEACNIIAKQLL